MATRIDGIGAVPLRRANVGSLVAAMPRWLLLLAVAAAVRALTFGNPVVHVDEEFYFVTAQRMLQGALPFVDIWDRKPIGLFLLYAPPAALGVPWGILAYQMMALASVVGTALLIARLADRVGWGRGAMAAALLYIFMLNIADGQGGQAPVFYNLVMAGAIAVMLPRAGEHADDRARIRRGILAMLLVGIALQIKYSVLFEGMFLGLWLLWREWRLGVSLLHIARRGAAYAAMAALPTLFAALVYARLGAFDPWFYANFGSILDRKSDPIDVLIGSFFKLVLFLAPALTVSALSRKLPAADETERLQRRLLFGWLGSAVAGLILFGSWFNHYSLPVMLPASLCCAGYFGLTRTGRRIVAPALLLIALIGGEISLVAAEWHRGNRAQLLALADAIGHGPGCMYIHSGNSILYSYTGRCTVSPWVFPSHLSRERENGAIGVDQIAEIDRIFANPPAVVVMRPEYFGERLAVRERTMAYLRRDGYVLRGRYPLGDILIAVYAMPVAAAATPIRAASRPS